MNVLILAAGYGTRLYPLTKDTPKPLLPIHDKPLIDYLVDKVRDIDHLSHLIVVTNHKFSPHFKNWTKERKNLKVKIQIMDDGTQSNDDRLGSMGDIDFVLRKLGIKEDILVLGGDNLFDQGLEKFISYAKEKSPRVTTGLFDIKDTDAAKQFGVVNLNDQQKVVAFEEKPKNPQSTLIGMCLYFIPKQSLPLVSTYLQETKKQDTSGDFIKWLFKREDVYGFTFFGKWYDIGSLEAYDEAQKSFRV